MSWLRVLARRGHSKVLTTQRRRSLRARLMIESLEERIVAYATTGNAWPHPQLLTISFQPDGTNLGGPVSNLFTTFNARFGSTSAWQNQLLKAAQQWAQQTNLNFAVVSDDGSASGTGSAEQGNPGSGDIRIGGYSFNQSYLALGYLPPPVNNYSIAGDIGINTSQPFNINGADYDLFTTITHEFGHALGLDHSSSTAAVLYATYNGVDSILSSDDIAGIRSIYSSGNPRSFDRFNTGASNGSFATAADITSQVDPSSKTGLLTNLDITTTSTVEYFKVTAPAGTSGTFSLKVQSKGLSLLEPMVKVYNASQSLLKSASATGYTGGTDTVSVNVTGGQQYYIAVSGVDKTAFSTGAYAMTLNFGTGSSPTVSSPNTQSPNGNPTNGGGGLADRKDANGISVLGLLNINLNLNNLSLSINLLGIHIGLNLGVLDLPFVDSLERPPGAGAADAASSIINAVVLASAGQQHSLAEALPGQPMGEACAPLPAIVSQGIGRVDPSSQIATSVVSGPTLLTAQVRVSPSLRLHPSQEAAQARASRRGEKVPDDKALPPIAQPNAASPEGSVVPAAPMQMETDTEMSSRASEALFVDPAWLTVSETIASIPSVEESETIDQRVLALAGLALVLDRSWRDPAEESERRRRQLTSV
jgi:hypothetical protein